MKDTLLATVSFCACDFASFSLLRIDWAASSCPQLLDLGIVIVPQPRVLFLVFIALEDPDFRLGAASTHGCVQNAIHEQFCLLQKKTHPAVKQSKLNNSASACIHQLRQQVRPLHYY